MARAISTTLLLASWPGFGRARGLLLVLLMTAMPSACARRPNIVLLLTDDQRYDSLGVMPNVQRLAAEGVEFRQALVVTPVCGPSRVEILTGRLASSQGVHLNEGAAGQFDPTKSIAVQLQKQGYTTALYGKYLNGYRDLFPAVPVGWNEWRVFRDDFLDLFKTGSIHVDPVLSWDGKQKRVPGYSTDLLGDFAADFIRHHAADPAPFFLMVSFSAPHVPLLPAPRHDGLFAGRVPAPPPSIQEDDLSDKPQFVRDFAAEFGGDPSLHTVQWQEGQQRTFEMLQSVDEAVGRILDALDKHGIAENTLVVFTSDNGFLFGEHGWLGKGVPYEESIHVPLVMRYPALARPGKSNALVTNLDLAPTFAALAGAEIEADGHNIVPLLVLSRLPWVPSATLDYEATMSLPQGYHGVRSRKSARVIWDDGRVETYDLRRDPYQLEGGTPSPTS
jgi:arylsulfatase A-like enzyme